MANPKKNTIHQQLMMRRASRSEYKDGLLRHNQRHENRLALELEQWEKAQRTVARGLEKESQWFKQSSSSGYNPQRGNPKRNSLTEVTENGQPRFIPDYQYRNRTTIAAQPSIAEYEQDHQRSGTETHENGNDAEKKISEHESSKSHKKPSKSLEGEGKKSSSKHGEHRRSSHSHSQKKSKHHAGERESKESDKVDSAKTGSDTTSAGDKKILKSAVEAAITPVKQNHNHSDKTTPSKSSSKSSKKLAAAADNATLPLPTTSDTTTTTTTTTTAAAAAAQSGSDEARPETASKTSSGGRSFSLCEDVHDPGDVIVSTKLLRELGWDGRRRYTNVWDSLSAPKHTSQVRSVRSRLQREFTQPPPSGDVASSKSFGGRSTRTASLF